MADAKILDRLAKLMEMSERGTEHEAALAGERAAELMAKHQLTMHDVTNHVVGQSTVAVEQGRVDDVESAPLGKRRELWQSVLLTGVVKSLGGRAWMNTARRSFSFYMIGPPGTVDAARYLYMALEKDIGRISRKEMKAREESNSWRRAYARGMAMRVGDRMGAARATVMTSAGTALVHVTAQQKAVDDAIDAKKLGTSRRAGRTKSATAIAEGWVDGADLDISDAPKKRLT